MKKFYITTPIFYVNDRPHIGHAFTMIASDVCARYRRLQGNDVLFLTGTDEHGAKIAKAAEKFGKTPKEFTDEISATFSILADTLNISNNVFIRTTDQEIHWPGVLTIWDAIKNNGDLYPGKYEGLYCIGHEAFIKKSDLQDGVCPDHQTKPEIIREENVFFKLSKYKKELQKIYEESEIKIYPESRTNEVLRMLEDSEDISFSRPRKDLKWGIQVPGDENQTIYVWADALTNYLSAIGYGRNYEWQNIWPADVHIIGKDILRFHAIIWPAMLLSAGLELPKNLFVHGFITVDGQKMSKTIGNVVDPVKLVEKYGVDPLRYFLIREIPSSDDGDFSETKLRERYNGDLANNLGNLVSRTAKLVETKYRGFLHREEKFLHKDVLTRIANVKEKIGVCFEGFRLHEALAEVFSLFSFANQYVDEKAPWSEKHGDRLNETMINLIEIVTTGLDLLWPFMPETAEKALVVLGAGDVGYVWTEVKVSGTGPLFPRLEN